MALPPTMAPTHGASDIRSYDAKGNRPVGAASDSSALLLTQAGAVRAFLVDTYGDPCYEFLMSSLLFIPYALQDERLDAVGPDDPDLLVCGSGGGAVALHGRELLLAKVHNFPSSLPCGVHSLRNPCRSPPSCCWRRARTPGGALCGASRCCSGRSTPRCGRCCWWWWWWWWWWWCCCCCCCCCCCSCCCSCCCCCCCCCCRRLN